MRREIIMAVLFHGTGNEKLRGFSAESRGEGYEANSNMGLWLTQSYEHASRYSFPTGRVLLVSTPPLRLLTTDDYPTVLWGDQNFDQDYRQEAWGMFDIARAELMSRGYDGVLCEAPETDLAGAVCVFRPETCVILADYQNEALADMSDVITDTGTDFSELMRRLKPSVEDHTFSM